MSSKLNKSNKKAFTIIEVVLVLAIAGLIFLIVFLALPGLQRNRRNTQRKSDVGRMIATVINHQANNGGAFPAAVTSSSVPFAASSCTPGTNCIVKSTDKFDDPSEASPYKTTANFLTPPSVNGEMLYTTNFKCDSSIANYGVSAGTGIASIVIKLEGGGLYCKDTGA